MMFLQKHRKLVLLGAAISFVTQCGIDGNISPDSNTNATRIGQRIITEEEKQLDKNLEYGSIIEKLMDEQGLLDKYKKVKKEAEQIEDEPVIIGKYLAEIEDPFGGTNNTVSYFENGLPTEKIKKDLKEIRAALYRNDPSDTLADRLSDQSFPWVFVKCSQGVGLKKDTTDPKECDRILMKPKRYERIRFEYKVKKVDNNYHRVLEITGMPGWRNPTFIEPRPLRPYAQISVRPDSWGTTNPPTTPPVFLDKFSDKVGEKLRRDYTGKVMFLFGPHESPNNIAELSSKWEMMQKRQTEFFVGVNTAFFIWSGYAMGLQAVQATSQAFLNPGIWNWIKAGFFTFSLAINLVGDTMHLEASPNWTPEEKALHSKIFMVYQVTNFFEMGTMFLMPLTPFRKELSKLTFWMGSGKAISSGIENGKKVLKVGDVLAEADKKFLDRTVDFVKKELRGSDSERWMKLVQKRQWGDSGVAITEPLKNGGVIDKAKDTAKRAFDQSKRAVKRAVPFSHAANRETVVATTEIAKKMYYARQSNLIGAQAETFLAFKRTKQGEEVARQILKAQSEIFEEAFKPLTKRILPDNVIKGTVDPETGRVLSDLPYLDSIPFKDQHKFYQIVDHMTNLANGLNKSLADELYQLSKTEPDQFEIVINQFQNRNYSYLQKKIIPKLNDEFKKVDDAMNGKKGLEQFEFFKREFNNLVNPNEKNSITARMGRLFKERIAPIFRSTEPVTP